jgi:uncharacterized protein YqeY
MSATADRIQAEVVVAMKQRQKQRLGILRMLQAAIKQLEIDERRDLTEDDVVKVVGSYARKVKDQLEGARAGGRQELADQAAAELAIVGEFLPAELTDAELEAIVRAAVAEVGAAGPRDMGKVMKAVMPQVTGRADGGRVSALVKQLLAGGAGG